MNWEDSLSAQIQKAYKCKVLQQEAPSKSPPKGETYEHSVKAVAEQV
jgi:hypothetical protein